MITVCTFKTADLNRVIDSTPVGGVIGLFKIPAGAKLILAPDTKDFDTTETVKFAYDDGQPTSATLEIGETT